MASVLNGEKRSFDVFLIQSGQIRSFLLPVELISNSTRPSIGVRTDIRCSSLAHGELQCSTILKPVRCGEKPLVLFFTFILMRKCPVLPKTANSHIAAPIVYKLAVAFCYCHN